EMVMEALRALDDVAYVRFASVYRNFREAKDFETVLDELSEDGKPGAAVRKGRQPRRAPWQSAQRHRPSDEISPRFWRLHAVPQPLHPGLECLPRALAVAPGAHADRI